MGIVPKEFFENRKEQAEIKIALTEAIPQNVYYHNLVVALAEMLARAIQEQQKEDVFHKWEDREERKP